MTIDRTAAILLLISAVDNLMTVADYLEMSDDEIASELEMFEAA